MAVDSGSVTSAALHAVGWVGQACFFSRFLLQWLASERAGRSLVPRAFWWLSLAGAGLMTVFTIHQREGVLLLSFLVGGAVATRNLWLDGRGGKATIDIRWLVAVAALFGGLLLGAELFAKPLAFDQPLPWLVVGIVGQLLWVSRFPVQWLFSERAGHSHFPLVFWWISLAGNLLLFAYALHLGILVYILGFLPGPVVQIRNLMLIRGKDDDALPSPVRR